MASETAPLVGTSLIIRRVLSEAQRAADTGAKILITGESGVGKDLLARYIHAHSRRAARPFVALNCAGLTESLLESELFGHTRGSFTGAYRDKLGLLAQAHGGTVFLDEVGEMSMRMQALLLRFLENGEIQPVGSNARTVRVDVRVVTATHRNLMEFAESGLFRTDLLYRIRVVEIYIPPLRERPEDIPVLIEHMRTRVGFEGTITREAMRLLMAHTWPGNARELYNVMEGLAALAGRREIYPEDLPVTITRLDTRAAAAPPPHRAAFVERLFDDLVNARRDFWTDVHPLFISRDITREEIRALVRLGLGETRGSYRGLLRLFRLDLSGYKRFLNFLAAHDCHVDFREYRAPAADIPAPARRTG